MDISSLTITIPVALSIAGAFIGIMTYFGNKKKENKDDEARLVSMEKDIQYIRVTVDKIDKKYDDHENRIRTLENECEKRKN